MPSIRYINQSAPFWDFIASLEDQGQAHPFFASQQDQRERDSSGDEAPAGPWGWGPPGRGGWHRGPHPHRHRHSGPPQPPQPEGSDAPPAPHTPAEGSSDPQQPPHPPHPHHEGPPPHFRGCHGRRGRGFGGRGGWGGLGGAWGGPGGFPMGGAFNFSGLAEHLFGQDNNDGQAKEATADDFKPEADIFDTESAYVVHVSLPGAKKEDVGVNWDAEKSELSIAGVIYRPGDEDFLKTLALDERKVGAFEKKIRLGSRANPAQVDTDMITAKLEDGVLRVEVPKLDKDYVEIKKVDIE
ncbi:HSP20-like chaperone [Cenococcum geophilum 1.58]|uniref:HSP20-like chaperone n=1 Tax=Cenococcum geophilum 1.58 TaxID=794803 RepID=UPI00358FCA98|nr:HSP20-like chaperone [Cenococcum geophilum 1.58]